MTDRMTNAPTADNANQVTAIRHIFNDKEMQGLVPKEDQGTPESVKEKIKDIINKTVVVEAKADDEKKPKDAEVTKADGKTERMKEDEARETEPTQEVFSISRVVSKITGGEEPKAETPKETVEAFASSARTESAVSRERKSAPAPSSVKKMEPVKQRLPSPARVKPVRMAAPKSIAGQSGIHPAAERKRRRASDRPPRHRHR